MKTRRQLFLIAGTAAAVFLSLCLGLFLVPDRVIKDLAVRVAEREGYSLRAEQFGTTFPPGVQAIGLEISNASGPLLKADNAALRLRILPLVTGTVTFDYQADLGPGRIRGDISPRSNAIRIEADGVRLEDIPFFPAVTGARVKGVLRLSGSFRGKGKEPGGELRLEIKGAHISGVKVGEIPLPDVDNAVIQGLVRGKGATLVLESFTLQGEGFYVRLKGDFPVDVPLGAAPLNLTLELMPKPEFMEKQKFVFLLLSKYLVSPGNYSIPVRGTLAKPLIE
jgi:type II secretion system protein N